MSTRGMLIAALVLNLGESALVSGAEPDPQDVLRIVGRHRAVWSSPPTRTPANHSVDGPLMGNGDMGVAVGGPPEEQQFHLCKNDLWRLKSQYGHSSPVGFGVLGIRVPSLLGASYTVTQTWASPETVGTFTKDDVTVRMRSRVLATRNLFLLDLDARGRSVDVEALLRVHAGRGSISNVAQEGAIIRGQREFLEDVDIPSGAAVALKVLDTATTRTEAVPPAARMTSFRVQLGREQFGTGRWGFKGCVDELRVYGRALTEQEMAGAAAGTVPDGATHAWPMDNPPSEDGIKHAAGRHGRAWRFTGEKNSYLDCGQVSFPIEPVTVAAWINIEEAHKEANYILSCGEWNKGVSLGLSAGKLRFAVNGKHVESAVLQKGVWIHVGGTWDGSQLAAYVNGKAIRSTGTAGVEPIGVRFTLTPGKPITLVLAMESVFKSKSYAADVIKTIQTLTTAQLAGVRAEHAAWWASYWAQSYVELTDPTIEKAYYRSLYHMGACSRDPRFPPGIFGWNTTDSPHWAGDYHLNYNHVAPFYGLYTANRIEQADPEDAPLLDFRPRGQWYAENVTRTRGVLYPVGIGPLGIETTRNATRYRSGPNFEKGGLLFQQRSNSAYCLVNIAQRWRTTYDPTYGTKVYPFVREVVDFWEDYLKLQDGRYVIIGDAIHEGSGQNLNPILSLGLIRNTFDLALNMSTELKVDTDRREKWRSILTHLSSWTTQVMQGKTVFRYTEKGTAWWRDNTLGIQHIYPGNALGLDSDPKWLAVARDTITVMGRWIDFNGSNSFFPAAVRVGYDPHVILKQLGRYVRNKYPNGFMKGNPHGIENYSTTPNTINEMLCMSHVPAGSAYKTGALLRVFPVWPRDRDARFVSIRTWGAFLVSSELKNGTIGGVTITSERGRDCTMVNPWPGRQVTLTSSTGRKAALEGARFSFSTSPGERMELQPSR